MFSEEPANSKASEKLAFFVGTLLSHASDSGNQLVTHPSPSPLSGGHFNQMANSGQQVGPIKNNGLTVNVSHDALRFFAFTSTGQ